MAKHGLSEEEVGDLKEAFSMFDIDGDGTCSCPVGGSLVGRISVHAICFVGVLVCRLFFETCPYPATTGVSDGFMLDLCLI